MSSTTANEVPQLSVVPAGVCPDAGGSTAIVSWQIVNVTSEPVEIVESSLPHSRFLGEAASSSPALTLRPRETATIERHVRIDAASGESVENAFLNLLVRYRGHCWRVLTRMRVDCAAGGSLRLQVEAVTAHRVGFAQMRREEEDR